MLRTMFRRARIGGPLRGLLEEYLAQRGWERIQDTDGWHRGPYRLAFWDAVARQICAEEAVRRDPQAQSVAHSGGTGSVLECESVEP